MKKSIIVDDLDHCVLCGKSAEQTHHCLFGNKRQQADEDGLTVPVCADCHRKIHNDSNLWRFYQRKAQEAYENLYGHEAYMERYGKNYL